MKKALILNGRVVDVVEKEFPVHPSMEWIDCDDSITTKHNFVNGEFVLPQEDPTRKREAAIQSRMQEILREQAERDIDAKLARGAKL